MPYQTQTPAPFDPDVQTPEQIAQHYSAAMDSVNLINDRFALETKSDQDKDDIKRNAMHLQIMLGKAFWTTEDLTPFTNAVTASAEYL